MAYRKIAADRVYTGDGGVLEDSTNRTVVVDESGLVLELVEPSADDEKHAGSLSPGFINAHGHLELAHLLGAIPRGTSLIPFLDRVNKLREYPEEEKATAIAQADKAMWGCGVSACGDISNGPDSLTAKKESPIRYFTFVELFGVNQQRAEAGLDRARQIRQQFEAASLSAGLSPHAPYTANSFLLKALAEEALKTEKPLTIHMQETAAEVEMFEQGDRAFFEFFRGMGLEPDRFESGLSSLQYTLKYLARTERVRTLFVHNTLSSARDVEEASGAVDAWWCLCPRANLYIENQLPDLQLFMQNPGRVLVGTDSLASNDDLNPLQEIVTIRQALPDADPAVLIRWATANGADFFGWDDLGRIEPGKRPGLVLISTGHDGEPIGRGSESRRLL